MENYIVDFVIKQTDNILHLMLLCFAVFLIILLLIAGYVDSLKIRIDKQSKILYKLTIRIKSLENKAPELPKDKKTDKIGF